MKPAVTAMVLIVLALAGCATGGGPPSQRQVAVYPGQGQQPDQSAEGDDKAYAACMSAKGYSVSR